MPIQTAAIPILLAGKNAYLNSETGTGKTLAYLLPLLCGIDPASHDLQAMILAPTHELAIQIQRVAVALTQTSGLPIRTILLIGGTAIPRQLEKLKKKVTEQDYIMRRSDKISALEKEVEWYKEESLYQKKQVTDMKVECDRVRRESQDAHMQIRELEEVLSKY